MFHSFLLTPSVAESTLIASLTLEVEAFLENPSVPFVVIN